MSKTGQLSVSGGISENEKRAHDAFSLTLDECGNGITPANVKSSVTLMMNNLEKINPGEVKERSSITLVGRKLSELVNKLMDAADPNVKTTIDLDYSLPVYARERRAIINQLEADCEKKKKLREVLEEPDRQEHEDAAFVMLQKEVKAWRIDEAKRKTLRSKTASKSSAGSPTPEEQDETEPEFQSRRGAEIKGAWLEEFKIEKDEYKLKKAAQKQIDEAVEELKKHQQNEGVIETLINGYISMVSTIANKIQAIAVNFPEVRSTLNGMVTLTTTGRILTGSYDKSCVAGMVQIIKNEFGKASFVSFQNDMVEAIGYRLSEKLTNSSPMKAVTDVSLIYNQWETLGYWQYMTKDIFFTCLLLNSLHNKVNTSGSDIRMDACMETSQFIRKNEEELREAGDEEMLIFKFVTGYIDVHQKSIGGMKSAGGAQGNGDKGGGDGGGKGAPRNDPRAGNRQHLRQLRAEEAAAADRVVEDEWFNGPVPRSANKRCASNPKFAYCATKHLCSECYFKPSGGGSQQQPQRKESTAHRPSCYAGQCNQCNLYGHTLAQCRQSVDSEGKAAATNKTKTVTIPKTTEKTASAHAAQHQFKSLTNQDDSSSDDEEDA